MEKQDKKRQKEIEQLTETLVIELTKYEAERSYRQLNTLRDQYQQRKGPSESENSAELLKITALAASPQPVDSPRNERKNHRLSLDGKELEKRTSRISLFRKKKPRRKNKKK